MEQTKAKRDQYRTATSNPPPVRVDEIVEQLESDIIFGRLRPNQELIEDALIERFAAKRHVVRSSLRELVTRRLAVKPPSKSARVKDLTPLEVDEIYHMRALLQRDAAHIMPLPVPVEELDAVKEVYVRHAAAAAIGADRNLIHKLNDEFHDALLGLCRNTELCKAIRVYTEASNPIRSYGIADKDWLEQAVLEHAAMIRAIEEQDRATLERLVVEHMKPTRRLWEVAHGDRLNP